MNFYESLDARITKTLRYDYQLGPSIFQRAMHMIGENQFNTLFQSAADYAIKQKCKNNFVEIWHKTFRQCDCSGDFYKRETDTPNNHPRAYYRESAISGNLDMIFWECLNQSETLCKEAYAVFQAYCKSKK